MLKSLLTGGTPQQGISKYKNHIWSQQLLLRYWAIWFPVQCLNFGVVPEHLRVPFCAVISFFWVCLLSSITAQEQQVSDKEPTSALSTIAASASSTPSFFFSRGDPPGDYRKMPLGATILMAQPPTTASS